jgi:hypothetical protein
MKTMPLFNLLSFFTLLTGSAGTSSLVANTKMNFFEQDEHYYMYHCVQATGASCRKGILSEFNYSSCIKPTHVESFFSKARECFDSSCIFMMNESTTVGENRGEVITAILGQYICVSVLHQAHTMAMEESANTTAILRHTVDSRNSFYVEQIENLTRTNEDLTGKIQQLEADKAEYWCSFVFQFIFNAANDFVLSGFWHLFLERLDALVISTDENHEDDFTDVFKRCLIATGFAWFVAAVGIVIVHVAFETVLPRCAIRTLFCCKKSVIWCAILIQICVSIFLDMAFLGDKTTERYNNVIARVCHPVLKAACLNWGFFSFFATFFLPDLPSDGESTRFLDKEVQPFVSKWSEHFKQQDESQPEKQNQGQNANTAPPPPTETRPLAVVTETEANQVQKQDESHPKKKNQAHDVNTAPPLPPETRPLAVVTETKTNQVQKQDESHPKKKNQAHNAKRDREEEKTQNNKHPKRNTHACADVRNCKRKRAVPQIQNLPPIREGSAVDPYQQETDGSRISSAESSLPDKEVDGNTIIPPKAEDKLGNQVSPPEACAPEKDDSVDEEENVEPNEVEPAPTSPSRKRPREEDKQEECKVPKFDPI